MSQIQSGAPATHDAGYLCPDCNSARVDFSSLAGGEAKCVACGWSGPRSELITIVLQHEFQSPDHMVKQLVQDVTNTLVATSGQDIGRVLLRWGFLDPAQIPEELPKYFKAIGASATKAIIELRAQVEHGQQEQAAAGTGEKENGS